MDSLRELGFNPNYLYIAGALVVLLIFFYAFMLINKQLQKGKRANYLDGVSSLGLSDLDRQGLLTKEEMSKVRQAMARQLEQRERKAANSGKPGGEVALLMDPEVRRLEELAELKNMGRDNDQKIKPSETAQQSPTSAQAPPQPSAAAAPLLPDDVWPKQELESSSDSLYDQTFNATAPTEDVTLPPDVVSMAQMGLITADELENIKQRIRAKKQSF